MLHVQVGISLGTVSAIAGEHTRRSYLVEAHLKALIVTSGIIADADL